MQLIQCNKYNAINAMQCDNFNVMNAKRKIEYDKFDVMIAM